MKAWRAWAKVGSLAALLATSSCFNVDDDDDAGGGGATHTGGTASAGFRPSSGGVVSAPSTGGTVSSPSTGGRAAATAGASSVAGSANAGASECAVCDHSQACCFAIAALENTDTDPCLTFAQTTCVSLAGPAREAIVTACQNYLQKQLVRDLSACH